MASRTNQSQKTTPRNTSSSRNISAAQLIVLNVDQRKLTPIEKLLLFTLWALGPASAVLLLFLAFKFQFKKLDKLNELFDMYYYVSIAFCIVLVLQLLNYLLFVRHNGKMIVPAIILLVIFLILNIPFLVLYSQRKKYSFKKNRIIVLVHSFPLILIGSIIALVLTLYIIIFIIKIFGSVGNK